MNLDSATSSTSSGPVANLRKERGSIAAQACETCRSRKQKCDENRPKCGLCQRMKLECKYREPQPTKKDKTLVEILDRLRNLEVKVDRIPTSSPPTGFGPPQHAPSSQPSLSGEADLTPYSTATPSQHPSLMGEGRSQAYRHSSAAHKILSWPMIQQLVSQSQPLGVVDTKSIQEHGSAFLVQVHFNTASLPQDESLQAVPFVGMQSAASRHMGGARATFSALTREVMHRLATAYFDTFNFIYPFMDRQNFLSDTLARVYSEGFDGDSDSVIALLVFALGDVAEKGSRGPPVEQHNGRPSGVRGGSPSHPPGLALFTEARKRIGFVLTTCDLENVQIYSLAALYHVSCFHYLDFWRMTTAASEACRILIACKPPDWNTPRGDLIKRAYWHCAIMDTCLHLELDLPHTGVSQLEDRVGMPSFNTPFCEADHRGNLSSHFEAHYASQVALRRLCSSLHSGIFESTSSSYTRSSSTDFAGPNVHALEKLAANLKAWRDLLPSQLQWAEESPSSFPAPQRGAYSESVDPSLSPRSSHPGMLLFTTDLDSEPVHYPYVYDVQVALLRTRYYHAKYMVYRPFVFKALHHPEHMTQEDAEGVAACLRSCLKWPITLSPTSRQKRLVPYLFAWSQNFLGILIIFYMTEHNPMLRNIRYQSRLCGDDFEEEVNISIELMLDWIRDLKSSNDPIATWCYKILQPMYRLEF